MIDHKSLYLLPTLLLALSGGAMAQGDDCSSPLDISGTGRFSFNNSTHTTSGFNGGGGCLLSDNIRYDGFYRWTAPASGHYIFDVRASGILSRLSMHTGSDCAALCFDATMTYTDHGGTILLANASMGDVYLVQMGSLNPQVMHLDVSTYVDHCGTTPDDAFEDNDSCATATPVDVGIYANLLARKSDRDYYSLTVAPGDSLRVRILADFFFGSVGVRVWDASDAQCGMGTGSALPTLAHFLNTQAVPISVVIEVAVDASAPFDCNAYDMSLSRFNCDSPVGQVFCCPANPNSTFISTRLTGSFGSGVGSDLHLEVQRGPAGEFGYFLVGDDPSSIMTVSNGIFCLGGTGGSFWRYVAPGGELNSVGRFDTSGVLQNLVGTSTTGSGFDVPANKPTWGGTEPILSGQTWYFQFWHRDTPAGVGSSNFSNGLCVTF